MARTDTNTRSAVFLFLLHIFVFIVSARAVPKPALLLTQQGLISSVSLFYRPPSFCCLCASVINYEPLRESFRLRFKLLLGVPSHERLLFPPAPCHCSGRTLLLLLIRPLCLSIRFLPDEQLSVLFFQAAFNARQVRFPLSNEPIKCFELCKQKCSVCHLFFGAAWVTVMLNGQIS